MGIAILGVVAVTATRFTMIGKTDLPTNKRSCEAMAKSVLSAIEEDGYYREMLNVQGANFNPTRSVPNNLTFWLPADPVGFTIAENNPSPALNNFQFISGSIRNLTTIYNNNAGVRCNFAAYAPLSAATLGYNLNRLDPANPPVVEINLTPFNADTGADDCAVAAPLYIGPRSNDLTEAAFAFNAQSGNDVVNDPAPALPTMSAWAAGPANNTYTAEYAAGAAPVNTAIATEGVARRNYGILLRSRVTYSERDGDGNIIPKTCEVSQRFQYPPDLNAPPPPPAPVISANTTLVGSAGFVGMTACTPQPAIPPGTVTIVVQSAAVSENGSQLLCRDLSIQKRMRSRDASVYAPAEGQRSAPCVMAPGAVLSSASEPTNASLSQGAHNGAAAALTNPIPLGEEDHPPVSLPVARDSWVPCQNMRVCGVQPTNSVTAPGPPVTITNTWTDALPVGCLIRFQVVSVDTAGRRSAAVTFNNGNPATPTTDLVHKNFMCGYSGNSYYVPNRGTYCRPPPPGQTNSYYYVIPAGSNITRCWSPGGSCVRAAGPYAGEDWAARFPNGYYTCRQSWGATPNTNQCCHNAPGTPGTCTPYN